MTIGIASHYGLAYMVPLRKFRTGTPSWMKNPYDSVHALASKGTDYLYAQLYGQLHCTGKNFLNIWMVGDGPQGTLR